MITEQDIRNVKIGYKIKVYPNDTKSYLKGICDYLGVDEFTATVIGMGDDSSDYNSISNCRILYLPYESLIHKYCYVGRNYSDHNVKFDSSIKKGTQFFGVSMRCVRELKIISSDPNLIDSNDEERGGLSFL